MLQVLKTTLDYFSIFIFQNIVIDRDSDMVKTQRRYLSNVLLCDEGPEMIYIVLTELGYPTTQINPFLKTLEMLHMKLPWIKGTL
jgi:hypothetical protein